MALKMHLADTVRDVVIGHCVFIHRVQPAAGRQNPTNIGQVSQQSGTIHNTKLILCFMYLDNIPRQCRALLYIEDGALIRPGPLRRVCWGPMLQVHTFVFCYTTGPGCETTDLARFLIKHVLLTAWCYCRYRQQVVACRTWLMQNFGGPCVRADSSNDQKEDLAIPPNTPWDGVR